MLGICRAFLLIYFLDIYVKCAIPTISVNKLNRKLVERKRKDTLDLCRMFNEENGKIAHNNHRRAKRALSSNEDDRVESIVDRLYDDQLDENGEKITYRQRSIKTTTKSAREVNRRFDFAPAFLDAAVTTPQNPGEPPRAAADAQSAEEWHKKWKHGIVPFFIDPKTYDFYLAEKIVKAFEKFEHATCIRLQRLRTKPTDKKSVEKVSWLYIVNDNGIRHCKHTNELKENTGVQLRAFVVSQFLPDLGQNQLTGPLSSRHRDPESDSTTGSRPSVNSSSFPGMYYTHGQILREIILGYDCMSEGEILHELLHILGFSHEHVRSDRDRHVNVLWDNIKPGFKRYFETHPTDKRLLSLPYDYGSLLHYPPRAFSKNGKPTLLVESGVKVGQRVGLSELDIEKVSKIYGNECMNRNKEYLMNTCEKVVSSTDQQEQNVSLSDIKEYFKDRLWHNGVVNYKLRDIVEFTTEERENIKAVIKHIEKETCIEFNDLTIYKENNPNMNITEAHRNGTEDDDDNKIDANEITATTDTVTTPNTDSTTMGHKGKSGGEDMDSDTPNFQLRSGDSHVYVLTRTPGFDCPCPTPGRPDAKEKDLEIGAGCFNSPNELLHLFVHVLGLDHQHNMHDRDSFLAINWTLATEDIKKEMEQKLPAAASVGFSYDYQSVMHYPWLQIKDGVTSLMYPIWNDGWVMGHWQGLSSVDVQKINTLYNEHCESRDNAKPEGNQ